MALSRASTLLLLAAAPWMGSCTGQIADAPDPVRADVADDVPDDRCGPAWVGVHRLNKREYANTLRDLLGVPAAVGSSLPDDPLSGGFDTNAGALTVSPELYERYVDVAETAVDQAFETNAAELVPCTPAANAFTDACVADTVLGFAKRAYRRPLTTEDRAELETLYAAAAAETGDVNATLAWVFAAVVSSPSVLYRSLDLRPDADGVAELDQHALATRLSYFLWSSTPDDRLLELADAGRLREDDVLRGEVRRMLADDRARDFTRNFTVQWLDLRGLEDKVFDSTSYPDFDSALLRQMIDETSALVHHVVAEDVDPRELLTAQYTFAAPELLAHYGAADAPRDAQGRSLLPADERRGVLTHGAVLAATAHPDRTSVPSRGMWVMENVLCLAPPPPPPPGVDTTTVEDGEPVTQRERLERHRADPSCAGCHEVMDELGFGLEEYDAVGVHRVEEHGLPIDARGTLPDGRTFDGALELAEVLANDTDGTFARCLSENLLAYAIGRIVTRADGCDLEDIAAEPALTASELLVRIVSSPAFQTEGAPEVGR